MAKTIPQLTDATTVNAADELIIQQGGITKRATGAELAKGLNSINGALNVKDFGAVGDGVADDRAAIQSAIDAVTASGGGTVALDAKSYAISSTINIGSAVSLIGRGSSQYPAASFVTSADFIALPKTRLVALSGFAGSTPMVSLRTLGAAKYTLQGATLQGVMLDCANIAARGLDVVSVKNSRFTDLLIYRPTALGIFEDVLAGGDVTTEGNNATQFNTWDAITVWCGNTGAVVGWRQTGTSAHNINQCTYNNIQIVHANGTGLDIVNGDTNLWKRITTFSFGSGVGCVMHGADLSEAAKYARNNTFVGSLFGGANAGARSNTAQSGTFETIVLDANASATNDIYAGKTITLTGGTGAGQVRRIASYVGSTKTATVTAPWATTPDNTTTFSIQKGGGAEVLAGKGVLSGTAQAGASSTITLAATASSSATEYTNLIIRLDGGTGSGEVRRIFAYNGSTKVATVNTAWTTPPDNTTTYSIYGVGLTSSGNALINNQSEGNGAGNINIESRASCNHLDERFAHFCDTSEPSILLENPRVFTSGALGTIVGLGKLSEGAQQELARLKFLRQGTMGSESCRIDFETYQSGSIGSRAFVAQGMVLGSATGADKGGGTINVSGGYYINNIPWLSGSGTPEGNVTAGVGSLWSRTNGGASTTLYVKESGTGNTGWTAK
jgi:hypothetical protein